MGDSRVDRLSPCDRARGNSMSATSTSTRDSTASEPIDFSNLPINRAFLRYVRWPGPLNRTWLAYFVGVTVFLGGGLGLAGWITSGRWEVMVVLSGVIGTVAALRVLKEQHSTWIRLVRIGRYGIPVTTMLVQANDSLCRPGTLNAAGLVFFTFDPVVNEDSVLLRSLANEAVGLKNGETLSIDELRVSGIVSERNIEVDRRRILPKSFTSGAEIFAADLWIVRSRLKNRRITEPFLTCLIEPGEHGGIELVPWWIAELLDKP